MFFLESIRLALANIRTNKMRSFLTMLGIIIGISAVITITTIGNSLKSTLSTTMNDLGNTNLIYGYLNEVYPEDENGEIDWETYEFPEMTEDDLISIKDIENYKAAFPDEVKTVLVENYLASDVKFKEGKRTATVGIEGVCEGYLDATRLELVRGREISERDFKELRHTAVVSDLFVKYACKPDEDPIGKEISLTLPNGFVHSFVIVGVYKYDKRILGSMDTSVSEKDTETPLYIPATTSAKLSDEKQMNGYQFIQIVATPGTNPTALTEKTISYFAEHVYNDNPNFEFTCQDLASELSVINKVLDILTVAISVIAAISLLVGGVGVMNIMLVSIMERTKEIGIRKALGAKNSNIRAQFLTEAVVICLIGGIIGILIGIANGYIIGFLVKAIGNSIAAEYMAFLTITVRPSIFAIVIAVFFSMLTGIIFGSYPAGRAAKLSPIDALRYE